MWFLKNLVWGDKVCCFSSWLVTLAVSGPGFTFGFVKGGFSVSWGMFLLAFRGFFGFIESMFDVYFGQVRGLVCYRVGCRFV